MERIIDKSYWENRYSNGETGWDLGEISPPIKAYLDQLVDKNISILIPGAGYGNEAFYAWNNGFTNITIVDIAEQPLTAFKQKVPSFPTERLIQKDFFSLEGSFDLIVEQTLFCAIDPTLRSSYAEKSHSLLATDGKLVGVLFDAPLNTDKPPFGGEKKEYLSYFTPYFDIHCMERCYNSHPSRSDKELFIILSKKS